MVIGGISCYSFMIMVALFLPYTTDAGVFKV